MSAFRVTYEISEDAISIKSVKAVNARVHPSISSDVLDSGVGIWVEVRDAKGVRVWARVLDDSLLLGGLSSPVGDGLGTMTRVPIKSKTIPYTVLVAAVEGGTVVFLHRKSLNEKAKVLAKESL